MEHDKNLGELGFGPARAGRATRHLLGLLRHFPAGYSPGLAEADDAGG